MPFPRPTYGVRLGRGIALKTDVATTGVVRLVVATGAEVTNTDSSVLLLLHTLPG